MTVTAQRKQRRLLAGFRVAKGYTQTAESLAVYRILYALSSLLIIGTTSIGAGEVSSKFGSVPDSFYFPPLGPAMLLDGWPSTNVIRLVETALTVGLAFVLIGAWTRIASIVTGLAGLILTFFVFGAGKVDHSILWIVVIPIVLAFSSWGDTWSVDAGRAKIRRRPGFRTPSTLSIQLIAICLGIMFAAAALVKACTGWLELEESSILGWAYAQDIQVGATVTAPPMVGLLPSFVWPFLDYLTLVFEAGFVVAALRRHWLVPYLALGVIFHFLAGFVGFPGFFDIAIAYLLFLRLDPVADRFRRVLEWFGRLAATRASVVIGITLICVVGYFGVAIATDGPLTAFRVLGKAGVPLLYILWPTVIVVAVFVMWRRREEAQEDRPGDSTPVWAIPAALAVLAVQTTLTLSVSEPYPSLAGPLFMGNFDNGREIGVVQPRFYADTAEGSTRIEAADVLNMSSGRATQLASVRFPAPYVDEEGNVLKDPTRLQELAQQYHHFNGRHLRDYGGRLDEESRAWVKRNLVASGAACGDDCNLRVEWVRLGLDRGNGRVLSERVVQDTTYDLSSS